MLEGLQGHFQTIWSPLFISEKDYSQVENIQDGCQSSEEVDVAANSAHCAMLWEKLQKTKNYISDSTGLS